MLWIVMGAAETSHLSVLLRINVSELCEQCDVG